MRIDKRYSVELTLIHFLVSIPLFYFSQYFFLIFLQIIYFLALFSHKSSFLYRIILSAYLIFLNYSLVLIFSFSAYIFYFITLFGVIYFINMQTINFTKKVFVTCGITALFTLFLIRYFDAFIYDIYLFFDVSDGQNFVNSEIFFVLTLFHTLILFFVLFRKRGKLEI